MTPFAWLNSEYLIFIKITIRRNLLSALLKSRTKKHKKKFRGNIFWKLLLTIQKWVLKTDWPNPSPHGTSHYQNWLTDQTSQLFWGWLRQIIFQCLIVHHRLNSSNMWQKSWKLWRLWPYIEGQYVDDFSHLQHQSSTKESGVIALQGKFIWFDFRNILQNILVVTIFMFSFFVV